MKTYKVIQRSGLLNDRGMSVGWVSANSEAEAALSYSTAKNIAFEEVRPTVTVDASSLEWVAAYAETCSRVSQPVNAEARKLLKLAIEALL